VQVGSAAINGGLDDFFHQLLVSGAFVDDVQ